MVYQWFIFGYYETTSLHQNCTNKSFTFLEDSCSRVTYKYVVINT